MEQNLVSDEELIKRINNVLNDSKEEKIVEEQSENSSADKFHDVSDSIEVHISDTGFERRIATFSDTKDLELENQILVSQLEAERRKTRELQSKFQLFEDSVKYFERLNGQLETIKQTVEEDSLVLNDQGDCTGKRNCEAMQKLRPKTVHTAVNSGVKSGQEDADDGAATSSEPHTDDPKDFKVKSKKQEVLQSKDEIAFRDADDFKQLDQNLIIIKDREGGNDSDAEKVFITKTEKKCLEDIGNIASRVRTPLDDKHQKFFEKDRRRFVNRIVMPETQEFDGADSVPADIVSKTKETPVNITSTELDGLRSYLLQLKELIARRETAWARTTERDYNQRVEITRFKNEVSHLRMLCEKRQKDIKERDAVIAAKEEEIKELQKRVQNLKSAVLKLEKKDDRLSDTLDGIANDVLENSQLIRRSYNVMKRANFVSKGVGLGSAAGGSSVRRTSSGGKEVGSRRAKTGQEKMAARKIKSTSSNSNDDDPKPSPRVKSKMRVSEGGKSLKAKHRGDGAHRKSSIERVDEKLQRIEEMLHSDVLKGEKKHGSGGWKQGGSPSGRHSSETRGSFSLKGASDVEPNFKKFTPSNSKMRQEMLGAITGVVSCPVPVQVPKTVPFADPKKGNQGNAAILASALLAARNTNMFNY